MSENKMLGSYSNERLTAALALIRCAVHVGSLATSASIASGMLWALEIIEGKYFLFLVALTVYNHLIFVFVESRYGLNIHLFGKKGRLRSIEQRITIILRRRKRYGFPVLRVQPAT